MQACNLFCSEYATQMGHVYKAHFQPPLRVIMVILLPLPGWNLTSKSQAKPLHSWPNVTLHHRQRL